MGTSDQWAFGLVGEVIERSWIVWVLKRMNGAVEEKVGKLYSVSAACVIPLIHTSYAVHSPSYGPSCRRVLNA